MKSDYEDQKKYMQQQGIDLELLRQVEGEEVETNVQATSPSKPKTVQLTQEQIKKIQLNLHKFIEAFREFKEDGENRYVLNDPHPLELQKLLQMWAKRPKKSPNFLLRMELTNCTVPIKLVQNLFQHRTSVKLTVNEKQVIIPGVLKSEGDYFYEGNDKRMMISSESYSTVYQGEVLNFKYHGQGMLYCYDKKNFFNYVGCFENGNRHGLGRQTDRNSIYVGEFQNDYKHGSGKEIIVKKPKKKDQNKESDPNSNFKSSYEGSFKEGLRHGKGNEDTPHGSYRGDWKEGLKDGQGILEYKNGDMYRGQWERGQFSGIGEYHEKDNCDYEGEFKNGKYHGKGKISYKNGDVYDGEFQGGKRHGKGKYDYADGDYYDGDWKNDYADGEGTCMFGGDFFVCEFKNGKKHGEGEWTNEQGDTIRGIWDNNILIKKIEINGEPYVGE